jgi:[pyruvate, water dikinase]-phosphate phosphotransferase / [pyruvate, water dikinase] kinase
MSEAKNIIIVSDGTGRTARRLMDAVLSQYTGSKVSFSLVKTYPQVRDFKSLDQVLSEIDDRYLVIYSIISQDAGRYFHEKLAERGILHLDVLKPMITTMSKFLGMHPDYRPGILQRIDDRYYKKVDAIGYTVEHDDGRGALIEQSDVILLGLSRTCKTPISMYLACNYGLKVANIPIVPGVTHEHQLLERLARVRREAVFGLLMQPEVLSRVCVERLEYLSRIDEATIQLNDYTDLRKIRSEFRYSRELFEKHNWTIVDVTRRAIEEISVEILDELGFSEPEEL